MNKTEISSIRKRIAHIKNENNPWGVEGQVLDWVNRCEKLLDDVDEKNTMEALLKKIHDRVHAYQYYGDSPDELLEELVKLLDVKDESSS
jgi:hypothetical protein